MKAIGRVSGTRLLALGIIITLLGPAASRLAFEGRLNANDQVLVAVAADDAGGPFGTTTPPVDPDPNAPAARMTRAQAQLAALISAQPANKRLLASLNSRVIKARAAYVGGQKQQIAGVMAGLSQAVSEAEDIDPPDPHTQDGLNAVIGELTASSQKIASRWLDVGRAAGADPEVIADAQSAYDAGVGDVATGNNTGGVQKFAFAFNTIATGVKWDIARFYTRLVERFSDQTTGLQFVMSHNGKFYNSFANGNRRMPQEEGPVLAMSTAVDLDIASVSKIITTVGVLQLLNARGLSITSKIWPWLPPHWSTGTDISELTFKDLLQHRSGLSMNSYCCLGWEDARTHIDLGVNFDPDPSDPSKTRWVYLNVNFVVLAALMARLDPVTEADLNATDFEALGTGEGEPGDALYRDMAADAYEVYVNENVIEPAGIVGGGACENNASDRPLYYDFANPTVLGTTINFFGIFCPYGGWHLSTDDLIKFMNSLRYTETLLPKATRTLMYKEFLGWSDPENLSFADGAWGVYHSHGGDLGLPGGVDACIMSFPNGTQVALLMNSINGDYAKGDTVNGLPISYQCSGISFDFDNAFVKA